MELHIIIILLILLTGASVHLYLRHQAQAAAPFRGSGGEPAGSKTHGILIPTELLQKIYATADHLFRATSADRVLLLYALNGHTNSRRATCVFEMHKHIDGDTNLRSYGAVLKYIDIEIDDHYRKLLHDIEANGSALFCTAYEKPSLLRDIYQQEGVQCAEICHIARHAVDDKNDILLYLSVATHTADIFIPTERLTIRLAVQKIRQEAKKIIP